MDWKTRRLLEHAGILRRGTPDHLLFEGDDEDPFGGDDEEEEDEGGGDDAPAAEKEPPEEIPAADFEEYGSPRFLELTNKIQGFFNSAKASGAVGAQTREDYPGVVEPLGDAEESGEEPTPAKDEEADEDDEEANESVFLSRRDKNLITEALRLLNEAGEEGAGADIFDMEMFATEFANYMESVDFVVDIQKGLYNFARQMILNNFDKPTEQKFNEMLAMKVQKEYDFLPRSQAEPLPDMVAAGASGDGGGGA